METVPRAGVCSGQHPIQKNKHLKKQRVKGEIWENASWNTDGTFPCPLEPDRWGWDDRMLVPGAGGRLRFTVIFT